MKKSKLFLAGAGLLLIILFCLAAFVRPGFLRADYGLSKLPVTLPELSNGPDEVKILSGEAGRSLKSLNSIFALHGESAEQGLYMERRTLQPASAAKVNRPWVWAAGTAQPTLGANLDMARLLVRQHDRRAFTDLWAAIRKQFLDEQGQWRQLTAEQVRWPLDMAYTRMLLEAYQQWPSRELYDQLKSFEERLWHAFQQEPKANSVSDSAAIIYPLTSSKPVPSPPEVQATAFQIPVITLDAVDLWTLKALATLRPDWQNVYAKWLERFKAARIGQTAFYAYAYAPEQKAYVPHANVAFRASTLSSLHLSLALLECGEQDWALHDLLFWQTLLQRDAGLCDYYHMVSLQAQSSEKTTRALALYLQLAKLLKRSFESSSAETLLQGRWISDRQSAAYGLLYERADEQRLIFFLETQIEAAFAHFQPRS